MRSTATLLSMSAAARDQITPPLVNTQTGGPAPVAPNSHQLHVLCIEPGTKSSSTDMPFFGKSDTIEDPVVQLGIAPTP